LTSIWPGKAASASSLNFSAIWPLGVFSATTWENLISMGLAAAWLNVSRLAQASTVATKVFMVDPHS
tara:strand:+ start:591 stop:791 length:201 start_codon:yes stop_codon:yes gene_type:complete